MVGNSLNYNAHERADFVNMKDIINNLISSSLLQEGVAWKRYQVKAGDTIIRKGDIGDSLFYLEDGQVRVLGDAELSETQHVSPGLCDLRAGAVFGDVCLYEPQERTATVTALTDARLIEINGGMLSVYLDDHPVEGYLFLRALFQAMVNRLALANDRIGNLLAWGIKAHDIDKYL